MFFVRKSFDFIGKYILYIIPMFVLSLLPQLAAWLATGHFPSAVMNSITDKFWTDFAPSETGTVTGTVTAQVIGTIGDAIGRYKTFISDNFPNFGAMLAIVLVVSLLLRILITPAMYATVSEGLAGHKSSAGDFFGYTKKYAGRYVLYLLGVIAFWLFWGFAALILYFVVNVLVFMIGSGAGFLILLALTVIITAFIYLGLLIVLWFPAMVVFDVGLEQGLRRSIKIVRKIFLQVLLTYFTTNILTSLLMAVIGALNLSITGLLVAGMIISVLISYFFLVYQTVICKSVVEAENRAYFAAANEENKV